MTGLNGQRPCHQAGGRPGDRAQRQGSLAEAQAAPSAGATAVPARLTTQVWVILGDKSPIATQRVQAAPPPRRGGCLAHQQFVPGGAPPCRPANIRTVPADGWCAPQAVHRPQRISLLNAMGMIVPATDAVRAMEPPWF